MIAELGGRLWDIVQYDTGGSISICSSDNAVMVQKMIIDLYALVFMKLPRENVEQTPKASAELVIGYRHVGTHAQLISTLPHQMMTTWQD